MFLAAANNTIVSIAFLALAYSQYQMIRLYRELELSKKFRLTAFISLLLSAFFLLIIAFLELKFSVGSFHELILSMEGVAKEILIIIYTIAVFTPIATILSWLLIYMRPLLERISYIFFVLIIKIGVILTTVLMLNASFLCLIATILSLLVIMLWLIVFNSLKKIRKMLPEISRFISYTLMRLDILSIIVVIPIPIAFIMLNLSLITMNHAFYINFTSAFLSTIMALFIHHECKECLIKYKQSRVIDIRQILFL